MGSIHKRDLGAVDALLGIGIMVVAVFAWVERSEVADPDGRLTESWAWQLWQIGPVVFSIIGVWMLWYMTQKAIWVRTLFLVLFALAIFINHYTEVLGSQTANVWYTIDALFIGCATLAAAVGWNRVATRGLMNAGGASLCANGGTGLGIALLINAYFVTDNDTAFEVIDPLIILMLLAWAIGLRCLAAESADETADAGA